MISVIIPARNEENTILRCLEAVGRPNGTREIIVVDGESSDATTRLALQAGARLISAPPCRGGQLNVGAAEARGDILLFLHADTILPEHWAAEIEHAVGRLGFQAGAFRLRIESNLPGIRLVEFFANLRTRLFHFPYGDQGLFAGRDLFARAGGFPSIPLMEDVAFVRRVNGLASLYISDLAVLTSGRRWEKKGVLRTTAANLRTLLAFLCGASPEKLARRYYGADSRDA